MRTIELKSITEPVRAIMRQRKGEVTYYEATANDIDIKNKKLTLQTTCHDDNENMQRELQLDYDYLVVGIGAQSTTFNIPGVYENANFLKEISDSEKIRLKVLKNIETASFLKKDDPERQRLLNFVVVGGGPTGVEFAAELNDYVSQDLKKWLPDISKDIKVTLVEALPNILNMFEKSLIDYTQTFLQKENIDLKLKTMVQSVDENIVTAKMDGKEVEIPYGVLVWATGNAPTQLAKKMMNDLKEEQTSPRGLLINDRLQMLGAEDSVFAIGDCTFHPGLFPTAQVAHQEGGYLAEQFKLLHQLDQCKWEMNTANTDNTKELNKLENKLNEPFKYIHRGTLSYIGAERAIVELTIGDNKFKMHGPFAFWFWKTVYLSMCLSFKNRALVAFDWCKTYFFGRDSSV